MQDPLLPLGEEWPRFDFLYKPLEQSPDPDEYENVQGYQEENRDPPGADIQKISTDLPDKVQELIGSHSWLLPS